MSQYKVKNLIAQEVVNLYLESLVMSLEKPLKVKVETLELLKKAQV
jgi:hypothetical protein